MMAVSLLAAEVVDLAIDGCVWLRAAAFHNGHVDRHRHWFQRRQRRRRPPLCQVTGDMGTVIDEYLNDRSELSAINLSAATWANTDGIFVGGGYIDFAVVGCDGSVSTRASALPAPTYPGLMANLRFGPHGTPTTWPAPHPVFGSG